MPKIEISVGELVDKVTILTIKTERILDEAKRDRAMMELVTLTPQLSINGVDESHDALMLLLKSVNEQLWDIEDDLRGLEAVQDFGETFVELARSVYRLNDERHRIKCRIDNLTGSRLTEVKSYVGF